MTSTWLNLCHLKSIYGLWSTHALKSRNFTLPVLIWNHNNIKAAVPDTSPSNLTVLCGPPASAPRKHFSFYASAFFPERHATFQKGRLTHIPSSAYPSSVKTRGKKETFSSTKIFPLLFGFHWSLGLNLVYYLKYQSPKEILMFASELLASGILENLAEIPPLKIKKKQQPKIKQPDAACLDLLLP